MGQTAGYGFRFGDGGGGLGIFIPESAQSLVPFANNAARDVWANANPNDLLQDQTVIFVTGVPDVWYIWRGQSNPTTPIDANDWETYTDVVRGEAGPQGTQGPAGPEVRRMFSSVANRDAFYAVQTNRNELSNDDIISVNIGGNSVEFQRWTGTTAPTAYDPNLFEPSGIRTSSASISFADELRIYDYGEIPAFEDMVNNVTALAIGQRFTEAGGSENARQLSFPAESTLFTTTGSVNSALQAIHTYIIDTTGLITNPAILTEASINLVVSPNFYIVEIFQGTDDTGQRVFRNRFDPPGTGIFSSRPPSPQRILPNTSYFVRLTGDIPFQFIVADGTTDTPAGDSIGFEFTFENLATQDFVNTNAGVIVEDEGIPLTTRGTTFNFTGSGVTASGTGAEKTINIPGGGGAAGVVVQDEGSPLTGQGETLNFAGSGVTASGTGATKTITIPGATPSTLTIEDEGSPLATSADTLNFTGAGVTASGTGAEKTINIPGASGVAPTPSLHNLTIDIPSRVDLNTNLNVQHVINFDVSNHTQITALNLIVTVGTDQVLTTPTTDGQQSQNVTLAGIDTTSAGLVTFQLSGTHAGGTATSNIVTITIADLQSQEQTYFGVRQTNDFASVDITLLSAVDVTQSGSTFDINLASTNTYTLGILSPANRDPESIIDNVLNRESIADFTETLNARVINSVTYNLLTLVNNSGFDGTFNFTVTTE